MGVFYQAEYCINTRDTDPFGLCRPSSLLGYLQEAATGGAEAGGFTREELLRDYHVFWMLARIRYRLFAPLSWKQTLTVKTWHRGNQGLMMYRDYDLLADGRPVGEAVSVWVLADQTTHKLVRISSIASLVQGSGGLLCKEETVPKLHIPAPLSVVEQRRIHYSDTDVNGHVNNSRYADFACDAIELARIGRGSYVSSMQLGYLKECLAGEIMSMQAGRQDGVWYVRGSDETTLPRFEASVTLSPLTGTGP